MPMPPQEGIIPFGQPVDGFPFIIVLTLPVVSQCVDRGVVVEQIAFPNLNQVIGQLQRCVERRQVFQAVPILCDP